MTTIEEMVKTFKRGANFRVEGVIEMGLRAVIEKHVRALLANAHEDGVRAGRSDVMMSNHNDYAARIISDLTAPLPISRIADETESSDE